MAERARRVGPAVRAEGDLGYPGQRRGRLQPVLSADRPRRRRTGAHALLDDLSAGDDGNLSGIPLCSRGGDRSRAQCDRRGRARTPLVSRRRAKSGIRSSVRVWGASLAQAPGQDLSCGAVPRCAAVDRVDHLREGRPVRSRDGCDPFRVADQPDRPRRSKSTRRASDPIPHIIDGIVVHVRDIRAYIDREKFILESHQLLLAVDLRHDLRCGRESGEPCRSGAGHGHEPVPGRGLPEPGFKPVFKVSTAAKTPPDRRREPARDLALPEQGPGIAANVARVKVSPAQTAPLAVENAAEGVHRKGVRGKPGELPGRLPGREAKVSTPILEGGLTGPAYFVSHGGAKYPELIMVLTGDDGITVQVHGETFISKQGITSATFNTVPDVPFSTFELTFPEREYPALTGERKPLQGPGRRPADADGNGRPERDRDHSEHEDLRHRCPAAKLKKTSNKKTKPSARQERSGRALAPKSHGAAGRGTGGARRVGRGAWKPSAHPRAVGVPVARVDAHPSMTLPVRSAWMILAIDSGYHRHDLHRLRRARGAGRARLSGV